MEQENGRFAEVEIVSRGPVEPWVRDSTQRPGCGFLLAATALAWLIEIADRFFGFFGLTLDALGIYPRQLSGLPGVAFSPWLHGGWMHLLNNSVAFLGLGFVMLVADGSRFLRTTLLLVLFSGLGTWLIGRGGSVHVGASGLIYGYFGYLILRAWTERRPRWIFAGLAVGLFYGGMLWGVLPGEKGVSWEAHLCGFLGGLWLGRRDGLQAPPASLV